MEPRGSNCFPFAGGFEVYKSTSAEYTYVRDLSAVLTHYPNQNVLAALSCDLVHFLHTAHFQRPFLR